MAEIEKTEYRGRESISISSSSIKAVFFTEFGAKFVSLLNINNGYEFLWQGLMEVHPQPVYDSPYTENDLCGADDLFPSINKTFYPEYPWEGIKCPPHGELWSIPWETEIMEDSVCFRTHGIRLPYSFMRKVSFKDDLTLRFDYRITNRSPFSLHAIWAFHPLFNAGPDTEILLPGNTSEIINTLDLNSRLGAPGSIHKWPSTTDMNKKEYRLNDFVPDSCVCEKFFINHLLDEGIAGLERSEKGKSVRLNFPIDRVPFLGIWKNQGGLLDQNNIALEPATGSLDDLYIAKAFDKSSALPAGGSMEFHLEISVY